MILIFLPDWSVQANFCFQIAIPDIPTTSNAYRINVQQNDLPFIDACKLKKSYLGPTYVPNKSNVSLKHVIIFFFTLLVINYIPTAQSKQGEFFVID